MENNSYIFWYRINENCFWAFIGKEVLKWSLMLVTGLLAINKQDGLGTRFVFVMWIIFPPTTRSVVTEHSPLPCSPRKLLEFVGVRVLFWWVSWDFKNRRGGQERIGTRMVDNEQRILSLPTPPPIKLCQKLEMTVRSGMKTTSVR